MDHVFGDILCQILAGDFLQLNPVRNHSLMGAFGIDVPGVPLYEKMDPVQRQKKQELDEHGYNVFRKFIKQTVLFRGSHRFKKGDPLATLLEKMRQVGGVALSPGLERFNVTADLSSSGWGCSLGIGLLHVRRQGIAKSVPRDFLLVVSSVL